MVEIKPRNCPLIPCPKKAWYLKQDGASTFPAERPEETPELMLALRREAWKLLPDAAKVEQGKAEDMSAKTKELIEAGEEQIVNATFLYNGLVGKADLLEKKDDGTWILTCVKYATKLRSGHYYDAGYHTYILHKNGIKVSEVNLMTVDPEYRRGEEIDPEMLFNEEPVTRAVRMISSDIKWQFDRFLHSVDTDTIPEKALNESCMIPTQCPFFDRCTADLPHPGIFDMSNMSLRDKIRYYRTGVHSFEDLNKQAKLTPPQLRQVKYTLEKLPSHVDRPAIRRFLSTLTYPLYFLDFECTQTAVPKYPGTRPLEQIPFQYSAQCLPSPDGEPIEMLFLGDENSDPRRALALQLIKDIPDDATVLAYSMSLERIMLHYLAKLYPDLSGHLLKVAGNLKDLSTVFQEGAYYDYRMQGSISLKHVFPGVCYDEPLSDYGQLDGVHNGEEALRAFATLPEKSPEERKEIRDRLLAYSALDTQSMVRIVKKLNILAKE